MYTVTSFRQHQPQRLSVDKLTSTAIRLADQCNTLRALDGLLAFRTTRAADRAQEAIIASVTEEVGREASKSDAWYRCDVFDEELLAAMLGNVLAS